MILMMMVKRMLMILGKGFEGKSTDRAKNAKTSKKPSRHLKIIVIRILIIIVIVFSIIATIIISVTPSSDDTDQRVSSS